MNQASCTQVALVVLLISIFYFLYLSQSTVKVKEGYSNFTNYNHYTPNRNAFGNYHRIGYEQSRDLGWKPSDTWDHLRPEYNECPSCFRKDPIYHY